MFIAIDHTVPEHHKLQRFDTLVEAEAFVLSNMPNGFAAADPGGMREFWVVDMGAKTVTADTSTQTTVEAMRVWGSQMATMDATQIAGLARTIEDLLDANPSILNSKPQEYQDNHAARKTHRANRP